MVLSDSECESLFHKMKEVFHKRYSIDFRYNSKKEIIVVFSPNARFNLYNYRFKQSVLFLSDNKLGYYLLNPGRQVKLIYEFLVASGFNRVVFIGSSKGGTGALLWSSLLSRHIPDDSIDLSCIVFSPQTKLYPYNKNLTFPSYKKTFSELSVNNAMKVCFERYGDVSQFVNDSDVFTAIFYSSEYQVDKIEAERISGKNVIHIRIPLPLHGSITPFIIDRKDEVSLEKICKKLYLNAQKDDDLRETLPSDYSCLHDILKRLKVGSIDNVIECFS